MFHKDQKELKDRIEKLESQNYEYSYAISRISAENDELRYTAEHILNSRTWRWTGWIRKLVEILIPFILSIKEKRTRPDSPHTCVKFEGKGPLISVLMPVYIIKVGLLRKAIESVVAQCYGNWELVMVTDGGVPDQIKKVLHKYAGSDARIRVDSLEKRSGISAASNRALEIAEGEFVVMMDHDDMLESYALCEMARAIEENPEADLIYSDEDKVDSFGKHIQSRYKPDWSPHLLLSQMYIGHPMACRKSEALEVGGFRSEFDGSQDYDLALRLSENARSIVHIPKVLYHWRIHADSVAGKSDSKLYAYDAAVAALEDTLARRELRGYVRRHPKWHGIYHTHVFPKGTPKVSIIIPTRDGGRILNTCISSILQATSYPNYEILLIDNGSTDRDTIEMLKGWSRAERVRLIKYDLPFNHSAICNKAASIADGDFLVLMNDDTSVITQFWLAEMLGYAELDEVGAVGCMLLFDDERVQHAGVLLGIGGGAGHAYLNEDPARPGYFGQLQSANDYSAVTAACLMVNKRKYKECGGFDEKAFPTTFNDVDFCLRLRSKGYFNVYLPFVRLYHKESATRQDLSNAESAAYLLREKWNETVEMDPYYNPNLSLSLPFYQVARIPRKRRSSRQAFITSGPEESA